MAAGGGHSGGGRDYRLTELDSGVRVATERMPAVRSGALGVWIGTGSRYETDECAGIAHFLEHMLFKGTVRRPSAQLVADTVERLGGRIVADLRVRGGALRPCP